VWPNQFRQEYLELRLKNGAGRWIFRDDAHEGKSRTQLELGFYHTSRDLGLRAVPRLVKGSWAGRRGSLQRVVKDAQRSSGSVVGDARMVSSPGPVDWDSLHAVAIQHFVTGMHDDAPYNILMSRAADGRLHYDAIDGEWTFGHTFKLLSGGSHYQYSKYNTARSLIEQGGPRELSAELWERIRRTNIPKWTQHLAEDGVEPAEVALAVERLRAVQERGLEAIW
jgi:hypothetical protein